MSPEQPMGLHTLLLPEHDLGPELLFVDGDEAWHAVRVKRVQIGDRVRVCDGKGLVLIAAVEAVEGGLNLRVKERRRYRAVMPRVEVVCATPKGPRLEDMIDMLSQAGAASWAPLETQRGVVDPGAGKIDRCERLCRESAKQCGRAWVMEIGGKMSFAEALRVPRVMRLFIADRDGPAAPPGNGAPARLLVGPEGGFTEAELQAARNAGALEIGLGPHTLRIETAAVLGTAALIAAG